MEGQMIRDIHWQWATRPADERYETLEACQAAVAARRSRSRTARGHAQFLSVVPYEEDLAIQTPSALYRPTHWSMGQLCQRAHAPVGYLRTLTPATASRALTESLHRSDAGECSLLVEVANGELGQLRAVTSPDYGRIWDSDVVDTCMRIRDRGSFRQVPDWSGKASGVFAGDRDVFIFLCDGGSIVEEPHAARGDGRMYRGFYVANSEVGAGYFRLGCFLYRFVCGNLMLWGAHRVFDAKIRHNRLAPEHFTGRELLGGLRRYLEAPASVEQKLVSAAQSWLLPAKDESGIIDWVVSTPAKLTQSEVRHGIATAHEYEGDCRSLWQLVQGVTQYAAGLPYQDMRVDLSRRAGRLMDIVMAPALPGY